MDLRLNPPPGSAAPLPPFTSTEVVQAAEPSPYLPPEPPSQTQAHPPKKVTARSGLKYRKWSEENMQQAIQAIKEGSLSLRKASQVYHVPKTTLAERLGERPPELPAEKSSRTRYTWTEDQMTAAVEAMQGDPALSISEASRSFGVPSSGLNARIRGRAPRDLKGEVSRLTLRQEDLLADWATALSSLGLPATKDEVHDLAERVLRKTTESAPGPANSERRLGKQWVTHWHRRYPKAKVLDWKSKENQSNSNPKPKNQTQRQVTDKERELPLSLPSQTPPQPAPSQNQSQLQDLEMYSHNTRGVEVMNDAHSFLDAPFDMGGG